MSNSNLLSQFSGKYQLSKTLRFELKPQGKTLHHIETKGLINEDEKRAESYREMKKTIDGFHKHFIELALGQVQLTHLEAYSALYFKNAEEKKNAKFETSFKKVRDNLRKEIARGFNTGEAKEIFAKIDKKELITELLEQWINAQKGEEIYFDEKFKTFTTYFGGFHENRKNMYTDKEQSTAIAYRLVHENLPKFLDNSKTFKQLQSIPELKEKYTKLFQNIQEHLPAIGSIQEAFQLHYYNQLLTQRGIDTYNLIIGGQTIDEGRTKIQGLNEYINLYNQKQERNNKIPKLKVLYKQILSDRSSHSFLPDAFAESQEVLDAIENYYKVNLLNFKPNDKDETENVLEKTKELLAELPTFDLTKIYLRNDKAITNISKTIFGDWGIIKAALEFSYVQTLVLGKKGLTAKQNSAIKKYLEQPHYSIAEIETALLIYKNEAEVLNHLDETTKPICHYFGAFGIIETKDLIQRNKDKYSCIKGILGVPYPPGKKLNQEQKTIDNIKAFLDSLNDILHFIKPLALPADSPLEKDDLFYGHFTPYYQQLEPLITLYNKVRNFATQKPYSTEKFKLNFENANLLKGWPLDREIATSSLIFRDETRFYLGILDKESKRYFKDLPKPSNEKDSFEKMVYLQAADPSKGVQNLMVIDGKTVKKNGRQEKEGEFAGQNLILEKLKNTHLPDHINNIRKKRSHSKLSENYNKSDLTAFIEYYKQRAIEYFDSFTFIFKKSGDYNDFSEFTSDINEQAYQINFTAISRSFIDDWVNQGKLYLFQIYNKDFSPYSKGTPNMHTLYWKALFDPQNLSNVVYKLNGQGELFYRKKSIDSPIVHKANQAIDNKNPNATKTKSTFAYNLVKDKRYTVDKFQFHVPITLNFKATGNEYINTDVLQFLKNNPSVNIIGLDRGERNLIYLTLINQKGEILKQESLNTIVNTKHNISTPYHTLLDDKEKQRDEARKNWGSIETIKELKAGYLSQVVHKIAQLMVQHNAIVVMEDLNFGFKRGRFKVEKQVYQKLEKMLIDKLNYLVFKNNAPDETAGLYNALQLTNKFKSFKEMGKQSGFLFYVPAWNTSKIDPTTGFVNLFYTKYESVEKARTFFSKFESIRYNADKKYFEFEFDYSHFTNRAEGTKTNWTVCTHGKRIQTFRNLEANNKWDNKEVDLTEEFENLFGTANIIYGNGIDLKEQLHAQNEKAFYKTLLSLFKLTLQMRNSITRTEIDYLVSPVINSTGNFFDSRNADDSLPKDADANGAYHIAKKGLWVLEQINTHSGDDWKELKLAISNREWLQFVQNTR